jgi:pimeloyl-ACP methyl ester carboxylesterase
MSDVLRHRLSVRVLKRGGPVAKTISEISPLTLRPERIIVLVHGFANDEDQAMAKYETLLRQLPDARIATSTYGFFWPGDTGVAKLNPFAYPFRLEPAHRSAELLGRWLAGLDANTQVILVAHSLGCRIVLEAVLQMMDEAANQHRMFPDVTSLLLMAAAVPTQMCRPNPPLGRYGSRPGSRRDIVLYSGNDGALFGAFPFGEVIGERRLGTAVGHAGKPRDRWDKGFDTGLDHGDYYAAPVSAEYLIGAWGYTRPRPLPAAYLARRRLVSAALSACPLPKNRLGRR